MINTKEIRKILKVLLRKSKGLNRIERIKEMDKGLIALNLAVVRQKRDKGFSFVSYETFSYKGWGAVGQYMGLGLLEVSMPT